MGTQAGVHQPRYSIKRLAVVKLAGPDTHWGGHGETADRISNSLPSRPSFHQRQAHPRKETVGREGRRGEGAGVKGEEFMTGEEERKKTERGNYSDFMFDGHVVEGVRGS